MRRRVGSLLVMLFHARAAARPASGEVAERLLAGHGAPSGSDTSARALGLVLSAAARPGTESELAGEADAVAAFLLAAAPASARKPRRARRQPQPRAFPRRVPVLAGGSMVALVLGLYGTAAAGVLPPSWQRVAHSIGHSVGVPVPEVARTGTTSPGGPASGQSGAPGLASTSSRPVPSSGESFVPGSDTPEVTPPAGHPTGKPTQSPSGTPTPSATPTTSNGNGNGNGNGAGNGNGKGNGGSGNGVGNGNGNGGTGTGNGKGSGNGVGNSNG